MSQYIFGPKLLFIKTIASIEYGLNQIPELFAEHAILVDLAPVF